MSTIAPPVKMLPSVVSVEYRRVEEDTVSVEDAVRGPFTVVVASVEVPETRSVPPRVVLPVTLAVFTFNWLDTLRLVIVEEEMVVVARIVVPVA